MEASNRSRHQQGALNSQYIRKDAPGNHAKDHNWPSREEEQVNVVPMERQTRDFDNDDRYAAVDQRNDMASRTQPEMNDQQQQLKWNDFATTVHSLGEFICAPCFVNTSNSMDSNASPPPSSTAFGTDAAINDDDMHMLVSSTHSSPRQRDPIIRFPSVHLDMETWEDEEDGSGYFDDMKTGASTRMRLQAFPPKQLPKEHEAIYRTPSSLPTSPMSKFAQQMTACSSQWSTTAAGNPVGIYRSPAWTDDDDEDDDDDDVVSLANDDEAWPPIMPDNYRSGETSQSVIDLTHIEDMFGDCTMSG